MLEKIKNNFADTDIIIRKTNSIILIYLETLVTGSIVNDICINKDIYINKNNLIKVTNYSEIENYLLNGFIIFYENNESIYTMEVRSNLDRGINSSESEISIRGPKDSFNENFNKNLGLIRNRIRSSHLKNKNINIGKLSNTKVSILYINNIAKLDKVNIIEEKLKSIDIDGIIDSSYLKKYFTNKQSIFPTIEETERPDVVSMKLLEGKIAILVDNSPYILIMPCFFIDFFHTPDDYYSKASNISFIRIIRLLAFFVSIFIPSYYIAITTLNHDSISTDLLLNFINQRASVKYPAIVEALLMSISFEILRESDLRMSSTLGTAVSILGGLVLGDALVSAGIVSPIMIIVIAISAIAGLSFTSVELTNSIRTIRFIFMILASIFGIYGLFIGIIILITNLASINFLDTPYLYPYAPLNLDEQKDSILKVNDENHLKKRNKLLTNNMIRGK